jgi:hypothetical protein
MKGSRRVGLVIAAFFAPIAGPDDGFLVMKPPAG